MALLPRLAKIVGWLRGGGADGPPWHGDIPLLALRGRPLTDDDVTLIAGELAFSPDPDSGPEIKKAIKAVTRMSVGEPDVVRVRSRLAAAGWPRPTPDPEWPLK
jgi:hypothetical protein